MQRSTFKVLFYVKRQSEKHGQVPVMGRITINGTMSQFSSKLSVRSSLCHSIRLGKSRCFTVVRTKDAFHEASVRKIAYYQRQQA